MIYLSLAFAFFKLGLFAFGGGYAMIPLMQSEIEAQGWIDAQEFADIVAISQMTPGPIAVNAATYIGYRTAGVLGSAFATFGVFLPSFILIVLIAHFIGQFRKSRAVDAVLRGVRPATIGLIASAVIFFAEISVFRFPLRLDNIGRLVLGRELLPAEPLAVSPGGAAIFLIILIGSLKLRLHPIGAVALSMALGILLM